MSYRTIEVEGKEYEYVIGRTYVKFRGYGVVPKENIGTIMYSPMNEVRGYEVRPAQIAAYIKVHFE